MSNMTRTTNTLRDTLFSQLDKLVAGEITAQQAKATTGLASQIINVSKLELEAARFINDVGSNSNNRTIKSIEM